MMATVEAMAAMETMVEEDMEAMTTPVMEAMEVTVVSYFICHAQKLVVVKNYCWFEQWELVMGTIHPDNVVFIKELNTEYMKLLNIGFY